MTAEMKNNRSNKNEVTCPLLRLLLVSDSVRLPVVRSSSRVKHFKIHQGDDGFHIEPKHHFSSLIDVVDFYCANSLNTTGQLGKPCKKVSLGFIPPSFICSSCVCDGAAGREQPLVLHGCECLRCTLLFPPSEKARNSGFEPLHGGRVGAPEGGVHAGGGAGQRLLC